MRIPWAELLLISSPPSLSPFRLQQRPGAQLTNPTAPHRHRLSLSPSLFHKNSVSSASRPSAGNLVPRPLPPITSALAVNNEAKLEDAKNAELCQQQQLLSFDGPVRPRRRESPHLLLPLVSLWTNMKQWTSALAASQLPNLAEVPGMDGIFKEVGQLVVNHFPNPFASTTRWKSAPESDTKELLMAVNLAEKAYDETHRYQDGLQLTHPQTGDHFGHVIKSSRRKQIHIVIRGTRIEKSYDVVHNLMVCGSRISQYLNGRGGSSSSSSSSDTTSNSKTLTMGYVHAGYLDVAKSIYPSILSALKQQFGLKSSSDVTTFEHLLKDYEIIIVGHSLGGAVAQILSLLMFHDPFFNLEQSSGLSNEQNQIKVITISSPKVFIGDNNNNNHHDRHQNKIQHQHDSPFTHPLLDRNHLRLYHEDDIVPQYPPPFLGFKTHVGIPKAFRYPVVAKGGGAAAAGGGGCAVISYEDRHRMSSEEVAEASMMRDSIQKSLVKMMLPFLFHCPPHLNADSLEQIHNMKVFRDEFLKSINNGVAVVEEDVVR